MSVPQPQTRRPRRTVESAGAEASGNGAAAAPGKSAGAGEPAAEQPIRRNEPKVGRNDPCPCGSGKKYKKCHGAAAGGVEA